MLALCRDDCGSWAAASVFARVATRHACLERQSVLMMALRSVARAGERALAAPCAVRCSCCCCCWSAPAPTWAPARATACSDATPSSVVCVCVCVDCHCSVCTQREKRACAACSDCLGAVGCSWLFQGFCGARHGGCDNGCRRAPAALATAHVHAPIALPVCERHQHLRVDCAHRLLGPRHATQRWHARRHMARRGVHSGDCTRMACQSPTCSTQPQPGAWHRTNTGTSLLPGQVVAAAEVGCTGRSRPASTVRPAFACGSLCD
jgi:hypothetical protein